MNKYFIVIDKNMACALRLLTKQTFYTFNHDEHGKVYSFIRTAEIERAYAEMGQVIKKFR